MTARRQVLLVRGAVVAVGLVGLYLSLTQPAVLTRLGVFSAAWAAQSAPPAIAALLGVRWATRWGAIAGPLAGTVVLFLLGLDSQRQDWRGLHAGFWALAVNLAVFVAVSLLTPHARPLPHTVKRFRKVGW
jgi:Na+/proline symporter